MESSAQRCEAGASQRVVASSFVTLSPCHLVTRSSSKPRLHLRPLEWAQLDRHPVAFGRQFAKLLAEEVDLPGGGHGGQGAEAHPGVSPFGFKQPHAIPYGLSLLGDRLPVRGKH